MIAGAIAAGNYQETACGLAGISVSTLHNWLERGRKGGNRKTERPYVEFLEAIKKAEAAAEASRIKLITNAAIEDWKAAAWYLERRFPDRWGRRERVQADVTHAGGVKHEHSGPEGGAIEVEALVSDPITLELVKQLYRREQELAAVPGSGQV